MLDCHPREGGDLKLYIRISVLRLHLSLKKEWNALHRVTNDLARRVYEHRNKILKGFTSLYNVDKLVHYETTNDIVSAITREKQLKKWNRQWKINLIEKGNPDWEDLSKKMKI